MPTKQVILVVGGAGFIGSHMTLMLEKCGYEVVVFDNLTTGRKEKVFGSYFVEGDLLDLPLLERVFDEYRPIAVMHFAALTQVGESVHHPDKYYLNNLFATKQLLDVMVKKKVKQLIFSSTAAIFGEPASVPVSEFDPKAPINPYGRTKLMVEQMLADYDMAYGLKAIALRYFNAAGADPEGRTGETSEPETHLIPIVLRAALRLTAQFEIFGTDYPTKDGTCVRDFIHVNDLCSAHLLALEKLVKHPRSDVYNLGSGHGFTVREVLDAVQKVTGKKVPTMESPRRAGDPALLVADAKKAERELSWRPQYSTLDNMVGDTYRWQQKLLSHKGTNTGYTS